MDAFKDRSAKMPKRISQEALREIEAALEQYERQVLAADLRPTSKATYLLHARNFTRWLKGEFTPGIQGRQGP